MERCEASVEFTPEVKLSRDVNYKIAVFPI